jgi:PAT family beta-lactamase induction signal transducer AmpG
MSFSELKHAFGNRRMLVVLLLGFSCGIPLALTGGTLQAWMTREGVSLSTIGAFSLIGLPYTLKFLWAPFLDRMGLPFLGHRKGWILVFQLLLILGIFGLGYSEPKLQLEKMAVLSLLVAFFSASQDIVVDALRTEILKPEEQGPGAGLYVTGYRIAMLVSGALAMTMSDHMTWPQVYTVMALFMALGMVGTFISPEPIHDHQSLQSKSIKEAFVEPLIDYFSRKGAVEIAIFIILYKVGDTLAAILATPFLVTQGYSNTDIGLFNKFVGTAATIVGASMGGWTVLKIGMKRSLFIFGIFQAVSTFVYLILTYVPATKLALGSAIFVENICAGLGTAAFSALLMRLCNKSLAGGQYAVLSSLMAVARVLLGPVAGTLADSVGWSIFFTIAVFISLPGILMVLRYDQWMSSEVSAGEFRYDPKDKIKIASIFATLSFLILFFAIPSYINTKVDFSILIQVMGLLGISMAVLGLAQNKGETSIKSRVANVILIIVALIGLKSYQGPLPATPNPLPSPVVTPAK